MTWRQSTFRKIRFDTPTATPSSVGPGKYNISSAPVSPKRCPRSSFALRDCLPRPDLVTPGPGSYDVDSEIKKNRPLSAFFKSRTRRDCYFSSNNNPSPAEYANQSEWNPQKQRNTQLHHPKRRRYQPHIPENANYLDERGRLVRRNLPKRTAADIGPGTYETATESHSRTTQINATKRDNDLFSIKKYNMISPDKYSVQEVSYKLPIKIKGENKGKEHKQEINQNIGLMSKTKIPTKPSPIFANHIARNVYDVENDVPGPGAYLAISDDRKSQEEKDVGVAFMSRSIRFTKHFDDNPGPGSYAPKLSRRDGDGPASVLKNRELVKDPFPTNDVVGPGQYNLPKTTKVKAEPSPAFKSREVRMPSSSNGLPGPSDYHPDFPEEKSATIINTRYAVKDDWVNYQMSVAPSPEEFTIDRDMHGPKYSIRIQSSADNDRTGTPGPGAYNLEKTFLKQSFNAGVPKLP